MLCTIAMLGVGFTSCSEDETKPVIPVLTASGEATSWGTATVSVTTDFISEYAWLALPAEEAAPAAAVVFKEGTIVAWPATFSTFNVKFDDAFELKDFVIYIAAKVASNDPAQSELFYEEVVEVPVTTLAFTDELTVIRVNSDGLDVHLQFPASVAEKGNAIKFGLTNMATYNNNVETGKMFGNAYNDASALELNDEIYPGIILHNDTTMYLNNETRFRRDASGEFVYDEWSGEAIYYWDMVAPGEPLYLIMAEVAKGEHPYGWGEGWYLIPFDQMGYADAFMAYLMEETTEMPDQNLYWNEGAWHKRIEVVAEPPKPYEGKVHITATDLSTQNGVINFTPDETTPPAMYTLAIVEDDIYQQIITNYLNGKEEHLQWFVTSYIAMYTLGTNTVPGSQAFQISMMDFFYELTPGGTYHAMAVCMNGEEVYDENYGEEVLVADPSAQSFSHLVFQLPDYTLDAPVIEVTALEPTSPYLVGYNVKCTTTATAPVVEAAYACNYLREFENELKYSTYADILNENRVYGAFSSAELEAINSPEGLNIEFDSREDATSRLAVMGWNSEGRPSNPDSEDGKAWADAKSGVLPDAERIESEYFTSLQGTWTATATVQKKTYDYSLRKYVWKAVETPVTSEVVIGDVTVPETLTDDVYEIYAGAGVSKEDTDMYFAQLQEETAKFNAKVRGQNRMLCTGWGFDKHSSSMKYSNLRTATPWDLFIDTSGYNTSTVDIMFYDFGPKWFIQVAEDGSLFIPVNVNRIAPLTNWVRGQEHYLTGVNAETGYALYAPADEADYDDVTKWNNIPVEVSEDGNTITIKSFVYDELTYYPGIIYNYLGSLSLFNTQICSDVVLTRVSDETTTESTDATAVRRAAANAAATVKEDAQRAISTNGAIYAPAKMSKSMTPIKGSSSKVEYKKLEMKQLTPEQIEANLKMLAEKQQRRARN